MKRNLTEGNVTKSLLLFAAPMILGNLMQQMYNIADTWVVGKYVGADALASAGSAYTLMTFLNSIIIGLCMGSGATFSYYHGRGEKEKMRACMQSAFVLIGGIAVVLSVAVQVFLNPILHFINTPVDVYDMMKQYVFIVFLGIIFIFLYNYYAFLLRALGNSVAPLIFLGIASVLNVVWDLLFVLEFHWGLAGAAAATVMAQAVSGIGLAVSTFVFVFSKNLMEIFVKSEETEIIGIGMKYLRIEGAFYVGIGILFLLYGFFRGINKPGMSLVLTIISLGTRVALAYILAAVPVIGVLGIWWSIPVGWALADAVGAAGLIKYFDKIFKKICCQKCSKWL